MSQPHESCLIWKLLIWILLYLIFEVRRSRGSALEQNEQKHENCSRAPPSEPILIIYTFKDWILFTDSESVYIEGHKRSNLGQIVELGTRRAIKSHQRSKLGKKCQNESNRADWSQKLFLTPCCKCKNWGQIVFKDSLKIFLKEWNSCILWLIIHDSLHMSHCDYDVLTSLTFYQGSICNKLHTIWLKKDSEFTKQIVNSQNR